jgi:secreted PhoX family phosphatase
MQHFSRRGFLTRTAAVSVAFPGLLACAARLDGASPGTLASDPEGVFEVAPGLTRRILSRTGDPMSDGLLTPGAPDGMAAFPDMDGRIRLVRNHELSRERIGGSGPGATTDAYGAGGDLMDADIYDRSANGLPAPGGTTTLVYNPATGLIERSWMSLAGTLVNCAGGPTPWNSWLTCEEVLAIPADEGSKLHGYVFEVPAAHEGLAAPVPLTAMGRFVHEAAAVDPVSGIVYLTEDERGLSLFYRFLPDSPGELARGGRLQALAVSGQPGADLRNWNSLAMAQGEGLPVHWVDLSAVDNPDGDLAQRGLAAGAAQFTRGEGCAMGVNEIYFTCTDGGSAQLGQVWRYRPTDLHTGVLELFVESADPAVMDNCDNVTVAPWGDLVVAEDGDGENRLLGVRPDGGVYLIGRNVLSHGGEFSELCGPCFSPDGSTLFFNIQRPGVMLAISGDWAQARSSGTLSG